jgi:hypothetical protein
MKKCSACQKEFSIDEFGKRKSSKDGLRSQCKHCEKDYYSSPEVKNQKRLWQQKKSKTPQWKKYISEYNKLHKTEQQNRHKKWLSNPENMKKRREKAKIAERQRRLDPIYRIKNNISRHIRKAINQHKGGRKWQSIVGYSLEELKKHLETTFKNGMNWNNYGQWHIDHIKPVDSFIIDKDNWLTIIKDIWSLNNLQALWAADNIKKSNKLICP